MSGRTIIVSGAAQGIGRACAIRQAALGDHVAVWDIDADAARAVADEIVASGGSAEAAGVDVSDTHATRDAVATVRAGAGALYGLINSAGVMRTLPFEELDEPEWDRVLNVNLRGAAFLAQAVAETIKADGGHGAVVLLASIAGRRGRPLAANYAASKAATISLAQSLAMAYGPTCRFNSVCPGIIVTPMQDAIAREREALFGRTPQEHYAQLAETIALKRVGYPDDVAKVVEFLMGSLSEYVTGQAINIDGGMEFD